MLTLIEKYNLKSYGGNNERLVLDLTRFLKIEK